MGKIKKPRLHHTPSVVPEEIIEDELELSAASQENTIPTILEQLQSPEVEEQYCGLQTMGTLIEEQTRIQEILSSGMIRSACPLLINGTASVRNSAAGVLNNLSRCGFEVCDSMIEQDAMTPIIAYFNEYATKLPPKASSKKKFDEEGDTFVQCVSLLLNLCESSEIAVKYFNSSNILSILVKYLESETYGCDITISVLQCLFIVSEDNVTVTEKIRTECEGIFEKLLMTDGNEPHALLLRILAAGIIINTCGGNLTSLPSETINKIMSILANTLSDDHRQACNQLSSNVPISDGARVKALKGKEGQILQAQIKSVTQFLNAQQTSIEIIANVFSSEDDEDSMEADDSDSENMTEDNISLENCTNGLSEQMSMLDKIPPEISEAMASYQLFDKVWSKTILPPDNTLRILAEYEDSSSLCKILSYLQSRALLCTNNMLSSLPLSHFGGVSGVYRLWVSAGKYAFKQASPDNSTLMESATAVMRSALYRIKTEDKPDDLFSDLSVSDVEMLLSGARDCPIAEIRSNLIRMLGSLALLLTSNLSEKACDVIILITGFILDQAHKESEVWVLAECVDTLLDLYAEDETDLLAAKTNLVDRLQNIAPILKTKSRQQRSRVGEHGVLVATATSNLPRFIKYKRQRLALLTN